MILKSKRNLSDYNEYCKGYVEEAYNNRKVQIGKQESGTGN